MLCFYGNALQYCTSYLIATYNSYCVYIHKYKHNGISNRNHSVFFIFLLLLLFDITAVKYCQSVKSFQLPNSTSFYYLEIYSNSNINPKIQILKTFFYCSFWTDLMYFHFHYPSPAFLCSVFGSFEDHFFCFIISCSRFKQPCIESVNVLHVCGGKNLPSFFHPFHVRRGTAKRTHSYSDPSALGVHWLFMLWHLEAQGLDANIYLSLLIFNDAALPLSNRWIAPHAQLHMNSPRNDHKLCCCYPSVVSSINKYSHY